MTILYHTDMVTVGEPADLAFELDGVQVTIWHKGDKSLICFHNPKEDEDFQSFYVLGGDPKTLTVDRLKFLLADATENSTFTPHLVW